jgi:hypothetical protein
VKERALAFEELGHERAEGFGESEDDEEVDDDLEDAVGRHG